MVIVNAPRPSSLFDQLPNRTVLSIVPHRSAIGRAVHSQVKVPAGVAAAVVAVVTVAAAMLPNR